MSTIRERAMDIFQEQMKTGRRVLPRKKGKTEIYVAEMCHNHDIVKIMRDGTATCTCGQLEHDCEHILVARMILGMVG